MSRRKFTLGNVQLMLFLEKLLRTIPAEDIAACLQKNYPDQLSSEDIDSPPSETEEILLELNQGSRILRLHSREELQQVAQCIAYFKIFKQYIHVWYMDGEKLTGPVKLNHRTLKSIWEMLYEQEISHLFRRVYAAIINPAFATHVDPNHVRIGHMIFYLYPEEYKKDTSINSSR